MTPIASTHELRFVSLYRPGRAITVPCDESGHVSLDDLPPRLKDAYLVARALVGREYAYPAIELRH